MSAHLLELDSLCTRLDTAEGSALAVDHLDLHLDAGETLGVVGESGSGKTMLALSILRLVPHPPATVASGRVLFRGEDLLRASEADMRRIRGNRISMIFQEPQSSLNPVFTVGEQVAEAVRLHRGASKKEALEAAAALFEQVRIPEPHERLNAYPHELSGGMRQRVVIAMALACDPELLLADEPTTALDVTIQAQILTLMRELREGRDAGVLLITHDLGVVAQACDRVAVMYTGRVVEQAGVAALFEDPLHPYTRGLMRSVPRPAHLATGERVPLAAIPGMVPPLFALPRGCSFHPRCPDAMDRCRNEAPPLIPASGGRQVRCWLHA